jgi:S-adenosylmethionine decarboxylase
VFFEGSEKKFEIILAEGRPSLLEFPREFWERLVAHSQATIIGEISSSETRAYLLSESSLFVWNDRVTMITCGQTTLARAAATLIKELGPEVIDCLIFQRKNEFRGDLQKSSFDQDVQLLSELIPGEALCFGQYHEHHNLLFSSLKNYRPLDNDTTLELLMYDVDSKALDILLDPSTCRDKTRELLGLKSAMGDSTLDDFCFDPFGYSLNALRGEIYLTIHVTPQKETSYISVETNADREEGAFLARHFLERLAPGSFDLITFNTPLIPELPTGYLLRNHTKGALKAGFDVNFYHYFHERSVQTTAQPVE